MFEIVMLAGLSSAAFSHLFGEIVNALRQHGKLKSKPLRRNVHKCGVNSDRSQKPAESKNPKKARKQTPPGLCSKNKQMESDQLMSALTFSKPRL
ncbi:hypothetical protein [Geoalkalibacter subterraneus]|uniref:hypothetical protein n=1 Tax=Geoalkalibacter subterraneus TaxID=483547 RepID=UPI00130DC82E|nr:hypothetical protein [Geoalkalibacter subterraneus]